MTLHLYNNIKDNIENLNYLKTLIKPIIKRDKITTKKRSALMVSAHNIKHLNKIEQLECDTIIINLEDGVAKEQKELARLLSAIFISNKTDIKKEIVVRVNPLDEIGKEDIALLNIVKPHGIRVPKIRTKEDVLTALDLIDDTIEVHLCCETNEAFNSIQTLKLDKRVTTIYLGILDLLADMNISQSTITLNNPSIDYILSKFLIDSKSVGFDTYSFIYQDFKNKIEFENWCLKEKKMGFTGKGCISPMQVEIANRVFSDSSLDIERAKEIIELFEENKKKGVTGFVSEKYGFIDEPIYKNGLLILRSCKK
jgi:citrate lyase subunit beta/citryl-CoA lyase